MSYITRKRPLRALSSLRLTLVLLVIFAVAIAVATFIESDHGREGSQALVYNARWFELVLALLTVNLILSIGRWFPVHPRQLGFLLVHVAMIVILLAAGMTRFLGYEGTLHIREGARKNWMLSRDSYVEVGQGDERESWHVRFHRPGRQSFEETASLNGRELSVTVEDFWPRYERRFVPVAGGEARLVLGVGAAGELTPLQLAPGGRSRQEDVLLAFESEPDLSAVGAAPLGVLEISVAAASRRVAVTGDLPLELTIGGFELAIMEFDADYAVGAERPPSPRMSNPALRVRVTAPDGASEERLLFAYYPEFSRRQGQRLPLADALVTEYRLERRLVFAAEGEEALAAASLPLSMGGRTFPAGEVFPVVSGMLYTEPGGRFAFEVGEFVASGVMADVLSDDPDARAAARIRLSDDTGASAEILAVHRRGDQTVKLGDASYQVAYGLRRIDLPHAVELRDFVLKTYPGGTRPAGYESEVLLHDPERGIEGEPYRIYMNHPLTHRNFKHFQSSYDDDRLGTYLTVSYDPGKWPTYCGYFLITLGFLLSLLKDFFWPRPGHVEGGRV